MEPLDPAPSTPVVAPHQLDSPRRKAAELHGGPLFLAALLVGGGLWALYASQVSLAAYFLPPEVITQADVQDPTRTRALLGHKLRVQLKGLAPSGFELAVMEGYGDNTLRRKVATSARLMVLPGPPDIVVQRLPGATDDTLTGTLYPVPLEMRHTFTQGYQLADFEQRFRPYYFDETALRTHSPLFMLVATVVAIGLGVMTLVQELRRYARARRQQREGAAILQQLLGPPSER